MPMVPMDGVVQYVRRPGIVDLGWGHPDPGSLPTGEWAEATGEALRRFGWMALTYGAGAGPGPLIEWLCANLAEVDTAAPHPSEVFVTGGASQGLEMVCALLARPGDVVLVDSPTYHLALRIIADRGVDLRPVPTDDGGMLPAGTEDLIRRLDREGHRVAFVYLVPTYGNPTGASLGGDRRRELVEVAVRTGTTLVEDDTYRELTYEARAPRSLWTIAAGGPVVRLGSFAKTVAPGLRLGWITADRSFVRRLVDRGFVDSGGGVNHLVAVTMAQFGASGRYARHLRTVRELYRTRRDALAGALREQVPGARFGVPDGGWFLWVGLPGVDAGSLLADAERAGVSYLPGNRFHLDPGAGSDRLRLSFSLLGPDALADGARRLARAVADAMAAGSAGDDGRGRASHG